MTRLAKPTLLVAASLTVMPGATISPSLPALADHFADTPGVDLLARLVLTVPALFIALLAPVAGLVMDRIGRKPALLFATVLYVLGGASGLVVDSLPALLVGRAVLGVAVAGVMTAATTLAGDYYSGAERQRFMGHQAAFMAFGGVVFLTTGGLLAEMHWRAPFGVYTVALLLLPAFLALPEPSRHTALHAAGGPLPLGAAKGVVAVIYLLAAVNSIAFYIVPTQLPFLLRDIGVADPSLAGAAIAVSTFCSAVTSMRFGRLRSHLSAAALFGIAFALMGAGYAIIAVAPNYPLAVAGLAVSGIGLGLSMPNLSLSLLAHAPEHLRGRLVGGLTTGIFLGQFLSPAISQPLAAGVGLSGMFAVVAAAALALAVASVVAPRALRRD